MVPRPRGAPPDRREPGAGGWPERVVLTKRAKRIDRRYSQRARRIFRYVKVQWVLVARRQWKPVGPCWSRCAVLKRATDASTGEVLMERPLALRKQREPEQPGRFRIRVDVDGKSEYLGRLCAWLNGRETVFGKTQTFERCFKRRYV